MKIKIELTRQENLARFNAPRGAVVELDLEREYLPVVVSSEVYEDEKRTPMEAKKAQAVAARTYAIAHMKSGNVIDDTANYQAFKWKDPATIPNSMQAVLDTAGQVLMHSGQLITAWYSNSNGGRTKRSDEAWSSYKPWTVAQDDPWDVKARAKWGECKASHGVGMSQMGAAYAAWIGRSYTDILHFYYAGCDIVAGYGESGIIGRKVEGGVSKVIDVSDLIQYAKIAVGGGYCWGSSGEMCSPVYRQELAERVPDNPTQQKNLLEICAKWDGMTVWDCSGLFRGAWRKLSAYKSGGATTIYNTWCTEKGPIDTMPDEPGIAVFRWGGKNMKHIGLYIGGGDVIEARGSREGVIQRALSSYPWTHWGRLDDVAYGGSSTAKPSIRKDVLYTASVINVKTGLNLRSSPKNADNTIELLKLGTVVDVLADNCGGGFSEVRHGDVTGYLTRSYLYQIEMEPKTDEQQPTTSPIGAIALIIVPVAGAIAALWPKIKAWWRRICKQKSKG